MRRVWYLAVAAAVVTPLPAVAGAASTSPAPASPTTVAAPSTTTVVATTTTTTVASPTTTVAATTPTPGTTPTTTTAAPTTTATTPTAAAPADIGRRLPAVRHPARRRARAVRAHAASDPAVTISDFQFGPSSVTIHVGDTVTWTNNGPTAHTATASDHSFDTGVLHKGGSGSHTFTQPGTFAYICSIHPFMHGTIVVLSNAAAATPSTTNTTATTAPTTPATTATQSGPSLPNTGLDLAGAVAFGLGLFGVGLAVRRRAR